MRNTERAVAYKEVLVYRLANAKQMGTQKFNSIKTGLMIITRYVIYLPLYVDFFSKYFTDFFSELCIYEEKVEYGREETFGKLNSENICVTHNHYSFKSKVKIFDPFFLLISPQKLG